MNIKTKIFIIAFITGGLLFSLIYWAMDDAEGKDFSIKRFLLRFVIFGLVMALSHLIGWQIEKRKAKKKG